MNDRRITNSSDRSENKLKAIAGLIQKLTYTEMQTLAKLVHQEIDNDQVSTVPEGLLNLATIILETKE